MKKILYYACIILISLVVSFKQSKAQNTIVIDDTSAAKQKEFKNFQGKEQEIMQSDLKEGNVSIQIDNKFLPVKLYNIIEGNPKPQPQPDGLKKAAEQLTGFVTFTLSQNADYDQDEIIFLLEMKNKKTFRFKMITKKDESDPETEGTALSPCKIEQLRKLNYIFISDELMNSLSKDPCGGAICKNCEPDDSIIQYDFLTNKTYRNPSHPKVGDPLEFIIRHVNPYIYNVTISDTTLNYNTNADGTYLGLLLGPGLSETEAQNFNEECILSDTDKVRKAIEDLHEQLNRFYGELLLTSPYTDASCFIDIIAKVRRSIDESLRRNFKNTLNINSYTGLRAFMKANSEIFTAEMISKLDEAYNNLGTGHFVYAYKVPEIDNVDEIQFRFNIIPKNKDLALPAVNNGVLRGYTKGGFKIDVSSGLYYGILNNDNFGVRKDSIETSPGVFKKGNRIYKEDVGKGEFGFASFLHFYPRTGGFINFSGTIGAGLNLSDDPKPRYFAGASILAGRGTSRLALNLGVICGNITQLSVQYPKDASGNYIMLPEEENELITKQKFKGNFFVSISYNLPFALKKTKMPQVTTAPAAPAAKDTSAKTDTAKEEETASTESQSSGTKSQFSPGKKQQPVIVQNINSSPMLKEKTKKKYAKKK